MLETLGRGESGNLPPEEPNQFRGENHGRDAKGIDEQ